MRWNSYPRRFSNVHWLKIETFIRLGKLLLIIFISLVVLQLFFGPVGGHSQKQSGEAKEYDVVEQPADESAKNESAVLAKSLGIFKENSESYLLAFAEGTANGDDGNDGLSRGKGPIGSDAFNDNLFPPIGIYNTTLLKRRRREDDEEVQAEVLQEHTTISAPYQEELKIQSEMAEKIVSHLLKSTEILRKGLGVCRKVVPKHFFNPHVDNATAIVIKGIVNCVQDKLQDDLGCQACITLHPDLHAFLNWLIKGVPGMPCCPPRHEQAEKNSFLFSGQEGFGGVQCEKASKIGGLCGNPSTGKSPSMITAAPVKKVEQKSRRGEIKTISIDE